MRVSLTISYMGRKKLKDPKTQRHFSVAYMHLMDELRPKLVPPGLQVSDGEMVDVCIKTLHLLLVEKGLTVVNPAKAMKVYNEHFRQTFAEYLATTLKGLGHKDVATKWEADGSITVRCAAGDATIPPEVFGIVNAESLLMEMKTGLQA